MAQPSAHAMEWPPQSENETAFLVLEEVVGEVGRIRFARIFKACLQAHGFRYEPFPERDAAAKWLIE